MENIFILVVIGIITYYLYLKIVQSQRKKYIDQFVFPKSINNKLIEAYPHLSENDTKLVMDGLRDYFTFCNIAKLRMISMPSQVVDIAWHEFILFTREYKEFCGKSFGKFLHHTPAEAMRSRTQAQDGIKRAWRLSCQNEAIDPHKPHKLPLLFALDTRLNIPDGFKYSPNCDPTKDDKYCGGHIGCGGGCGGSGGCHSDGGGGGCGGGGD